MSPAEIRIGAQVYDRALQRGGMVVAIHKHSNPDLPADTAVIKVAPGTRVWSRIADLEQS